MGVLVDPIEETNILTKHKFKYERLNCTGVLPNCYERFVDLNEYYNAWVAVQTDTGKVFIYVEYACGGMVEEIDECVKTKWKDSPEEFFEELDDIVTKIYAQYNRKYQK